MDNTLRLKGYNKNYRKSIYIMANHLINGVFLPLPLDFNTRTIEYDYYNVSNLETNKLLITKGPRILEMYTELKLKDLDDKLATAIETYKQQLETAEKSLIFNQELLKEIENKHRIELKELQDSITINKRELEKRHKLELLDSHEQLNTYKKDLDNRLREKNEEIANYKKDIESRLKEEKRLMETRIQEKQDEMSKYKKQVEQDFSELHEKWKQQQERDYMLRMEDRKKELARDYDLFMSKTAKETDTNMSILVETHKKLEDSLNSQIAELKQLSIDKDKQIEELKPKSKETSAIQKGKENERLDETILIDLFRPRGGIVENQSNISYSGDFKITLSDGTTIIVDSKSHGTSSDRTNNTIKKVGIKEIDKLKRDIDLVDANGGILLCSYADISKSGNKYRQHFSLEATEKNNLVIYLTEMKHRDSYEDIVYASNIIQQWKNYKGTEINIEYFISSCQISYNSLEANMKKTKASLLASQESFDNCMEGLRALKKVLGSRDSKPEVIINESPVESITIPVINTDIELDNMVDDNRSYKELSKRYKWLKYHIEDNSYRCQQCPEITLELEFNTINRHNKSHRKPYTKKSIDNQVIETIVNQ